MYHTSIAHPHVQPTPGPAHDGPETQLGPYIFSVFAGLMGVCLTVIGLLRVIVQSVHIDTIADNLLSIYALLFLLACLFAYLALRTGGKRGQRVEWVADAMFLIGRTVMVTIAALIAVEGSR